MQTEIVDEALHRAAEVRNAYLERQDSPPHTAVLEFWNPHQELVMWFTYLYLYHSKDKPSAYSELGVLVGALLHDLGKADIAIPTDIWTRPSGQVIKDELALRRKHPIFGAEFLALWERENKIHLPPGTIDCVLYHHEAYNGTGYPYGLKHDRLSHPARLTRVADQISARIENRHYQRRSFTLFEAVTDAERHSHVDPRILLKFQLLFSRQAHLEIPALRKIANMSENRARP